jgi:predicted dehydrogenase
MLSMLDRRSFLSHSAAISAALAALRETPLYAQDPKPAKTTSLADTLRVAVVGTGGRGGSHLGAFNGNHGCQIVTVCDADKDRAGSAAKAVAKKGGAPEPTTVQDMRRIFDDKSIDIVTFATPNHWHALGAIWGVMAGKHVYVEKPASHNVLEGRWMIDAARKHNRLIQVGTQSRSMPGMRQSIAYLHDGKLGKVKLAYASCYKRRNSIGKVDKEQPVPKGVDYDLWCGPARMLPIMRKQFHYDWHWIWEYGNGDLGNQGVHEMDKARWGLNKNEMPKSVVSAGGRFGYVDDGETANTQLCVFDYGDSELVFEVRGLPTGSPYPGGLGGKGPNFVGNIWYGEKGILVCPSYNSGVVLSPELEVVQKFSGGGDGNHFENFVKAVRSGKHQDLNCDVTEGHLSAALCHLANISVRLGKTVPLGELKEIAGSKETGEYLQKMVSHLADNNVDMKAPALVGPVLPIDPKTERFTGSNEKANAMLGRENRKGYRVSDRG